MVLLNFFKQNKIETPKNRFKWVWLYVNLFWLKCFSQFIWCGISGFNYMCKLKAIWRGKIKILPGLKTFQDWLMHCWIWKYALAIFKTNQYSNIFQDLHRSCTGLFVQSVKRVVDLEIINLICETWYEIKVIFNSVLLMIF